MSQLYVKRVFSQSSAYPDLVRLYRQIGRISESSSSMNELASICLAERAAA